MKRPLSFLLLFALLSMLLSGCATPEERAWQSGQKALAEEKYNEAAEAFVKAGTFNDAERLLSYAQAFVIFENGDFAAASAAFQALGDFKDSLLMDSYCRAREQESIAEAAASSEDAESAVNALMEANAIYSSLSLFRDSEQRASDCRELIYSKAKEWMSLDRYAEAATGFEALGDWQDCSSLKEYCKAASLEKEGSYLEAAERFSQMPDVLDSSTRAENARVQVYRRATELKEKGDYEAASAVFASLGSYRDAEAQSDSAAVLLIREELQSGNYSEALNKLIRLSDLSVFPPADPAANGNLEAFLGAFLNAWMNAHAGVMNGFFSRSLLQPYVMPDSELDLKIRAELPDDLAFQNYGYVFHAAEVREVKTLDDSILYARLHGSSSYGTTDGTTDSEEDLLVLVDIGGGYPNVVGVLPA